MDWRELYAANQAAIADAGVPRGGQVKLPGRGVVLDPLPKRTPAAPARGVAPLVHVPRGLDTERPAPLVCMLHGCSQDPVAFAAATLMNDQADRHGFVVVYPGQDRRSNAQGCWNWFLPEHQQRDAGEPAAIVAIIRELMETRTDFTIDAARVYVAGLSSGGAMAAILGACYPDVFDAVAVHSGLAHGSATSLSSALSVMARGPDVRAESIHAATGAHARPVPSIVLHGTADRTVAPANAIAVLRRAMDANHRAAPDACDHDPMHPASSARGQVDGGYTYARSRWLDANARLMHELIMVDGLGHAWSGGAARGSYADPRGPSATQAIWAFFAATVAS